MKGSKIHTHYELRLGGYVFEHISFQPTQQMRSKQLMQLLNLIRRERKGLRKFILRHFTLQCVHVHVADLILFGNILKLFLEIFQ